MVTSILGACELCLLKYFKTNRETSVSLDIKGSLILLQDSVGGVLEERSRYVLDSASEEAGQ